MRVAFKKTTTSLFGKLIKLWTWGPYCHAELVFSDGKWFSSDEDDGGTRWLDGPKPGIEYDYLTVPMTPRQEADVRAFCTNECGCRYDKVGLVLSFLPVPIGYQNDHAWFCSEVCIAGLQVARWLSGYSAILNSPNDLYKILSAEIARRGV